MKTYLKIRNIVINAAKSLGTSIAKSITSVPSNPLWRSQLTGRRFFIPYSLLLGAGFLALSEAAAQALPSLGLKVEVDGKSEYGSGKSETKTQIRTLKIALSNGRMDSNNLRVKWVIYGRTMNGNEVLEVESGEETVSMKAGTSFTVSTPEVSISGNRKYAVATGGGRRKRYKDMPASGERYYGYAVQVFLGDRLIAADYSQPSLKALTESSE